jgi:hypothetical protein
MVIGMSENEKLADALSAWRAISRRAAGNALLGLPFRGDGSYWLVGGAAGGPDAPFEAYM